MSKKEKPEIRQRAERIAVLYFPKDGAPYNSLTHDVMRELENYATQEVRKATEGFKCPLAKKLLC